MNDLLFIQRIAIAAVAALMGLVYFAVALRVRRCGDGAAPARFAIAGFAFAIAALVSLGAVAPVVGYSLVCLVVGTVFLADLVQDERARRRRVAMLSPRPVADRVPTMWIAITLLSTLTLVPYVIGGINVAAALIAGGCAIAMAAIAWRVASAPTQLTGGDAQDNPQAEHLRDRARRASRAGLTCVVAVGSVALFLGFIDATPPPVGGLGRVSDLEMLVVWAALWAWEAWYVRRVSHAARTLSS